jgi:hypothetical protein
MVKNSKERERKSGARGRSEKFRYGREERESEVKNGMK